GGRRRRHLVADAGKGLPDPGRVTSRTVVAVDFELRTPRLLLRRWRNDDREPFAALNADPVVMEHFPKPLDRVQSNTLVDRIELGLEQRGWGLWAVEGPGDASFVGVVGLSPA